jgi:hypothetical protein
MLHERDRKWHYVYWEGELNALKEEVRKVPKFYHGRLLPTRYVHDPHMRIVTKVLRGNGKLTTQEYHHRSDRKSYVK